MIHTFILADTFLGKAILDEDGNETGLFNRNPNLNGDKWIAGGMTLPNEEQLRKMESAPEMTIPIHLRNRELPPQVILIDNPEFPPVFDQIGGSCAQASGVAYTYSYQLNVLQATSATSANTRAYGFTHNYLNGGKNYSGSWYYDGWEILMDHGAPDVQTFYGVANGGLKGTRWMSGIDKWHAANNNRVLQYYKMKIETMADINKIKSWMYDLNGTDPNKKGGAVVFAANSASADGNQTVSSGPFAGEMLCTNLKKDGMDHAMTFAGYSDSVEGGALLLLNSYGTSWGTNGHVWVPYSKVVNGGLFNNEVWCVTVGEYNPTFEIAASITHTSRDKISIRTGFAKGKVMSPDSLISYGRAFTFGGGSLNMEGDGGDATIEIALNVSRFHSLIVDSDVTFFLEVVNTGGNCVITDTRLLDYTDDVTLDIVSTINNVTVSYGDTALIPIYYTPNTTRYNINAIAVGNGNINPEGNIAVDSGDGIDFKLTPDKWHKLDSLIVNDKNVGGNISYSYNNIMSHSEVIAYFSWDESTAPICTLTCNSAENGTINPINKSFYETGDSILVSIIPSSYHIVDSVLLNGKNFGPLYSADFKFISQNHAIIPFYSTKSYGVFYPLWDVNKVYGNGVKDTIQFNGQIWMSNWWSKGKVPGTGGEWTSIASVNQLSTDTLKISHLTYYSNDIKRDSIVIKTYLIFKSDTIKTNVETIVDGPVDKLGVKITKEKPLKIDNNGKQFFAPKAGKYEISLFDLRGRRIYHESCIVYQPGNKYISLNKDIISEGLYIIQVKNKDMSSLLKFCR